MKYTRDIVLDRIYEFVIIVERDSDGAPVEFSDVNRRFAKRWNSLNLRESLLGAVQSDTRFDVVYDKPRRAHRVGSDVERDKQRALRDAFFATMENEKDLDAE